MSLYTLHLSGPPQVLVAGRVIHGFESEKALALLAYLTLVGRPVNRDHLAGLFWGELSTERSRGNLRRVLHNLTHLLPDALEVERHSVRIVPEQVTVDVCEFQRQAADADLDVLTAALVWCGGELLEGVALADCPEFELWLVGERERWRAQVLTALETLITAHTRQGDYPVALMLLDRALALAPWLESLHRRKMLLLARSGHPSAALKQYEVCRCILHDELAAAPSHETEALRTHILAAQQRPRLALPVAPTPLVGRRTELAELSALLLDPAHRLITVTGPGGVGKSTLALAAAAETNFAFLDGVLFAPLMAIAQPDDLPGLLLHLLGLTPTGRTPLADQLLDALRSRELLLVLDNFEHLLAAHEHAGERAADLLHRLLEAAAQVKLLVTSRTRLHLRTEWTLPLQGLTLTADGAPQLFWQRLAQNNLHYVHTADDDATVDEICRVLAGLPLGIELAAAQSAAAGCRAVANRLHESPDALQSPLRDLPDRQRSLRAVFDDSWALLSVAEQHALAPLTLFPAEFCRAAAHAIAATTPALLDRLVDQSLLLRIDGERYALHPLVREFAAARLAAMPELAQATRATFAAHYLALLAAHNLAAMPARQREILSLLAAEWPNVQVAWRLGCAAAPAAGDERRFVAALDALYHFCLARSDFQQGRDLLAAALDALPSAAVILRGEVALRLGLFHLRLGDVTVARRLLEDQLHQLDALYPEPMATLALGALNLATVALHQGDYAATLALAAQSQARYRQLGDRWGEAMALNVAGVAHFDRSEFDAAQQLYRQALTHFGALGDARYAAKVLHNLATSYDLTGDHTQALAHFQRALTIHQANGEKWSEALARNSIGFVYINLGMYAAAEAELVVAGQQFAALGGRWGEMIVLANRCLRACFAGELTSAAELGQRAHDLALALGDRRYAAYAAHRLGNVLAAQQRWDEAVARYQEALVVRRELGQPTLALESQAALAWVAWRRGDLATAQQAVALVAPALDAAPAGVDEPLRLYLTCYAVLTAAGAARAGALLQHAVALLQARADRIADADMRAAYLQIAAHRALLKLAEDEKAMAHDE